MRPDWLHSVKVDIDSKTRPEAVSQHRLFVSDVVIRVFEGEESLTFYDRIEIHHPRGWMGAAARFLYEVDDRRFPTFDERAAHARRRARAEFPPDKMISVVLLGSGESTIQMPTSPSRRNAESDEKNT